MMYERVEAVPRGFVGGPGSFDEPSCCPALRAEVVA